MGKTCYSLQVICSDHIIDAHEEWQLRLPVDEFLAVEVRHCTGELIAV